MGIRHRHKRLPTLLLAGLRPVYARAFAAPLKKAASKLIEAAKGDLADTRPPGRARVLHEVEAPANNDRNRLPVFA
jgi:hypothetical protein